MTFKTLFGRRAALAAAMALVAVGAAGSLSAQSGDGRDRHVTIHNNTRHVMVNFYASNSGRDSWEEDILGQDTLGVGAAVRINIDDGSGACLYDFKAVFNDGESVIRNRINVCEVTDYSFTGN